MRNIKVLLIITFISPIVVYARFCEQCSADGKMLSPKEFWAKIELAKKEPAKQAKLTRMLYKNLEHYIYEVNKPTDKQYKWIADNFTKSNQIQIKKFCDAYAKIPLKDISKNIGDAKRCKMHVWDFGQFLDELEELTQEKKIKEYDKADVETGRTLVREFRKNAVPIWSILKK